MSYVTVERDLSKTALRIICLYYECVIHNISFDYYPQITAAGNILLGNTLTMMSQQKTFSVALSRKMSPMARMVVYCVKNEEILIDTLTFFVRDSRLHNVRLKFHTRAYTCLHMHAFIQIASSS